MLILPNWDADLKYKLFYCHLESAVLVCTFDFKVNLYCVLVSFHILINRNPKNKHRRTTNSSSSNSLL